MHSLISRGRYQSGDIFGHQYCKVMGVSNVKVKVKAQTRRWRIQLEPQDGPASGPRPCFLHSDEPDANLQSVRPFRRQTYLPHVTLQLVVITPVALACRAKFGVHKVAGHTHVEQLRRSLIAACHGVQSSICSFKDFQFSHRSILLVRDP